MYVDGPTTERFEWGWNQNLLLSTSSVPIVIAGLFVQVEVSCNRILIYSLYHGKWGQIGNVNL